MSENVNTLIEAKLAGTEGKTIMGYNYRLIYVLI